MCDIFETKSLNFNLMSQTGFMRTYVNISSLGLNSLKYLPPKICDIVPYNIKSFENLNLFTKKN